MSEPETSRKTFAVAAVVVAVATLIRYGVGGAAMQRGDEIVAADDVSADVDGVLSESVLEWIINSTEGTPMRPTSHVPAVDVTFTLTVTATRRDTSESARR